MDGVCAIIKKEGKYLMFQQPDHKPFSGKWLPPGGGVEPRETLEQALIREVDEEVGIAIRNITKITSIPGNYKVDKVHFFTAEYLSGDELICKNSAKESGWFSYEELINLDLMDATREFVDNYFKKF